jgi:hypothetical protein
VSAGQRSDLATGVPSSAPLRSYLLLEVAPISRYPRFPWPILLVIAVSACAAQRPSASAVSASKEAAARSASFVPQVSYGLEMETPRGSNLHTEIPWLELRGRAGTAELFESDLVIVLDLSLNMMMPSGMDLDGDGVIGAMRGAVRAGPVGTVMTSAPGASGRDGPVGVALPDSTGRNRKAPLFHPRSWTTDREDTVMELEMGAARKLIHELTPRQNRIGLVTYAERGRTRTPVGSPDAALEALGSVRAIGESTVQNVSAGLRQARLLFSKLDGDASARRRAVILFTDGRATAPADEHIARLNAMYEADSLGDRGIDLYVFAIGSIGVEEARFLLELAGAGRGRVYRLLDPHRLLDDLDPLELAPRWLDIVNTTTQASARAVRAGRDGRFDAFVPLAPGANRIRVIAELGDGKLQRWEKDVHYQPPAVETEAHRRATEAVLRELEERAAGASPADPALAPDPARGPEPAATPAAP